MRQRVSKLVIGFKTSTDAITMENLAWPGLGKIIPLPAKISAGCGLAFCADPRDEREIIDILAKNGIEHSGIHIIKLFESQTS
jgi:hypothetical protein